jgi:hypothetical protein
MIRMELNMANIKNRTGVCFGAKAVEISQKDIDNYAMLCNQNTPKGLNRTC